MGNILPCVPAKKTKRPVRVYRDIESYCIRPDVYKMGSDIFDFSEEDNGAEIRQPLDVAVPIGLNVDQLPGLSLDEFPKSLKIDGYKDLDYLDAGDIKVVEQAPTPPIQQETRDGFGDTPWQTPLKGKDNDVCKARWAVFDSESDFSTVQRETQDGFGDTSWQTPLEGKDIDVCKASWAVFNAELKPRDNFDDHVDFLDDPGELAPEPDIFELAMEETLESCFDLPDSFETDENYWNYLDDVERAYLVNEYGDHLPRRDICIQRFTLFGPSPIFDDGKELHRYLMTGEISVKEKLETNHIY